MKVGLKNPEHEMTLREVLVVRGLSANLFSPIQATAQQKGLQCMIEDGRATLIEDGKVLPVATSGTGSHPEFVADVEGPTEEDCMAVREEVRAVLWNRRMAHLSYRGLAKMADSKMVQGLPVSGADFRAAAQHSCDVCARAKPPQGPHKECSPSCTPRVLSALHVDLLEMRVPSRAGYSYVLGGVDSHSRFYFARPLKTKVETAAALEESIAILQRQNADCRMLQEMRTDIRMEFPNGVMEAYCKKKGVLHGKTTGYSSQSNGFGERC